MKPHCLGVAQPRDSLLQHHEPPAEHRLLPRGVFCWVEGSRDSLAHRVAQGWRHLPSRRRLP